MRGMNRAWLAWVFVAAIWLAVKAWKHRWLRGNFVADLRRRMREAAR